MARLVLLIWSLGCVFFLYAPVLESKSGTSADCVCVGGGGGGGGPWFQGLRDKRNAKTEPLSEKRY